MDSPVDDGSRVDKDFVAAFDVDATDVMDAGAEISEIGGVEILGFFVDRRGEEVQGATEAVDFDDDRGGAGDGEGDFALLRVDFGDDPEGEGAYDDVVEGGDVVALDGYDDAVRLFVRLPRREPGKLRLIERALIAGPNSIEWLRADAAAPNGRVEPVDSHGVVVAEGFALRNGRRSDVGGRRAKKVGKTNDRRGERRE